MLYLNKKKKRSCRLEYAYRPVNTFRFYCSILPPLGGTENHCTYVIQHKTNNDDSDDEEDYYCHYYKNYYYRYHYYYY